MINLLMTSGYDMWESSPAFFDEGRCLTEYISSDLKERYSSLSTEAIEELKKFLCVFAYEKYAKKDAEIGYITHIEVRQTNVRIDFKLTGDRIAFDDFILLSNLLDMGSWEWNRTHWTLKRVSLEDLSPHFAEKNKHHPTVFVSYCWTPPSNQKSVFTLISRLEQDGIIVKYDKKDLHPGQDMNYFMESALSSGEIDNVIIVCNSDYAKKADSRKGGVGYESELILNEIQGAPLQTRCIPVVIERDETGELPLPRFLKSRCCIDLTRDTGYDELLKAIRQGRESN